VKHCVCYAVLSLPIMHLMYFHNTNVFFSFQTPISQTPYLWWLMTSFRTAQST